MKATIILIVTLFTTIGKYKNFVNSKESTVKEVATVPKRQHCNLNKMGLISVIAIQNNASDSIKLNTFTELPNDIQGCACYFYLSKSDEAKQKYIMAEIFAQVGYISINGKMQKFNLIHFKDRLFYIYSNGTYILRVDFKNKIKNDSEDFRIRGTLTVFKGQKILVKKSIIGECAC